MAQSSDIFRDPYEILKVAYNATDEAVREAYLLAAKENHPDKGGDPDKMARITEAWAHIGTPKARRATLARMTLLGTLPSFCGRCGGAGTVRAGKGFTGGGVAVCPKCKGRGI